MFSFIRYSCTNEIIFDSWLDLVLVTFSTLGIVIAGRTVGYPHPKDTSSFAKEKITIGLVRHSFLLLIILISDHFYFEEHVWLRTYSCHRQVDWCGGYCFNGMGRLVIWAVIGMVGMCPIGWVEWWKCGVGRFQSEAYWLVIHLSLIPPLVPSPSPAASGPQSLDGFGWLLSDAKSVEVVAWLVPRYWDPLR